LSTPGQNPVPKRILVQENCVECGRPVGGNPEPFESADNKPLAPGNSQFQLEMPNEIQHQNPLRCEACRLAHHSRWADRKRQLPWLATLAILLLIWVAWNLLRN
tara:strand:+ start:41 stop:352 length:312 start_codon:yes stop_codon:yes gene_type:complete